MLVAASRDTALAMAGTTPLTATINGTRIASTRAIGTLSSRAVWLGPE